MAAKKADKKADKPKKEGGGGGGILPLVGKILGVLAILSAAVLFAAALDIGHIGLKKTLAPFAIAPLAVYALFGIAALFLGGGKSSAAPLDGEALAARIDEIQAKTSSRITALQGSIDAVSGQDYEALVEENKSLKEQLDAIHDARTRQDRRRGGTAPRQEQGTGRPDQGLGTQDGRRDV